jgi:CHAT domain-containing protein
MAKWSIGRGKCRGRVAGFFFLLVLQWVNGTAQPWLELADSLAKAGKITEAIALGESNLPKMAEDSVKSQLLFNLGLWYSWQEKPDLASAYYERALLLEEKLPHPRTELLGLIYNNLAYNSTAANQNEQIIKYYKKAHELWYNNNYTDIRNNLTGLGNLLFQLTAMGLKREVLKYYNVLEQYEKAFKTGELKARFMLYPFDQRINMLMYLQLTKVRVHRNLNHYNQLKPLMEEFEKLFSQSKKVSDSDLYLEALDNMGYVERYAGRYNEALAWYKKAERFAHNDFYRMKSAANQAVTYYYAGEASKALLFTEKALAFLPPDSKSLSAMGLRAMRAELLAKNGNFNAAFAQLEALFLHQLNKSISSKDFIALQVNDFKDWIAEQQLSVFLFAGNCFLHSYKTGKHPAGHLKVAHHFYRLASQMFSLYYTREDFTEGLQKFRNRINGKLLETGIMLDLLPQEWITIMSEVENNTSKQGWKSFLNAYSKHLGIPAEWLKQRQGLLAEKEIGLRSSEKDGLVRQQKALRALDSLNRLIQQKSPRFLEFDTSIVSFSQYQKQMLPGQAMLRYLITDNHVFGMLLSAKGVEVKQLATIDTLKPALLLWRAQVRNPASNIQALSRSLYNALLAPFEKQLTDQQEIVIVTEGELSWLSFEAIAMAGPAKVVLPITYAYDIKLLQLQRNFKVKNSGSVAFAPDYASSTVALDIARRGSVLVQLQGAQQEAMQVANLLNGRLYLGAEANKPNFLKAMGKYGTYHVAMHAYMDTLQYEMSCLVFSDTQKLYFGELYNRPFNAAMVVLSGCNTGVGIMLPGEGAMGLSRALAYSGVQSLVYALWELPDNETSWIVQAFYEGLKAGLPKQEALAMAKRRFLETFPEKAHPFFWAGLVVNGNTAPLKVHSNNFWWLLIAIPALLLLVFVFHRKNKTALTKI